MEYRFMRFPGGKQKAVTFSYDDGVKTDIRLAEIFDEHGMKATFNICSSMVGTGLTESEIRQYIIEKGHEVAVHGAHHLAPGKLRPIDGIREFLDCRLELEEMFDMIIRGMAYPNSGIRAIQNGGTYEDIRGYLKNIDIAYARTLAGDNDGFFLPEDWFAWIPTAHHDNPKIFEYIDKFINISDTDSDYCDTRYPRLFYIWGHSYEFDRNENWDRIEKICSLLGNRRDTWYATNIEIHDYVAAYNSLIFSANGKRVYNPTDKKVWFKVIGTGDFSVEAGGTLLIPSV